MGFIPLAVKFVIITYAQLHRTASQDILFKQRGIMVQGKAKATLAGRTIAETEEYELVEGNVYVSIIIS